MEEAASTADSQALKIILDAVAAKDALKAEEEVLDSKLLQFIYRWLNMPQSELLGTHTTLRIEKTSSKASDDHVETSKHDEL